MLWSCAHVSVRYRQEDGTEVLALDDVSFSVRTGERVCLVGPNGSGKSTLALLMAGLINPSAGAVSVDGHPPIPPTGAIAFQSPEDNLLGATVAEELALSIEHRMQAVNPDASVDDWLERFGLTQLAKTEVGRLSGGEKQIVALACALASGKSMVVMDEPTSHLDPPGRRRLWEFLAALPSAGDDTPAIVFVTQYRDDVVRFDRVIALDRGRIIHDGPSIDWPISHPSVVSSPPAPPESGPVLLSVRGLGQKSHPGWPLPPHPVRDVSLEIRAGEAIGLCGPIGAGKTTLALLLAGLLDRFEGARTCVGGQPVMLIQFPERQLFCRTCADEIAVGLRHQGLGEQEIANRVRDYLTLVGLPPDQFARRDPFSLSGGQKRRLIIAAAAALTAPLYILDEPQAALDESGISMLRTLTEHWRTRGASYLLISHDLVFLRRLTHRLMIISGGELVFDGDWDRVEASPKPLLDIGFPLPEKTWI
ncbi:MAG TPA: ATP-binding cassette domain-containing protein [bacterium]|nr:ATP-binding cassette domain-containing protein [bacterium]